MIAARRLSADRLVILLLIGHVLLKLAVLPMVVAAPPYNDEQAYLDAGRALSNLVRDLAALSGPDGAELERNVVGSGWFMPGMGLVLTPLFLVVPDAPDWLIRVYLGVGTTAGLVAVARSVRRRLGPSYAAAVVAFPGLVPAWVVLSCTAYGDVWAGLLLVALVARLVDHVREAREGRPPTLAAGLVLGLLGIAVVYLRSSAAIAVVVVAVVGLGLALAVARGAGRWRLLRAGVAGVVAFVALLTPWSVAASSVLGDRVLTTTTVPVSLANTFAEGGTLLEASQDVPPDEICFGPCDPDSTQWFAPLRYSRELARATGESEVHVQRAMAEHALREVSATEYGRQTFRNLGSYLLIPANFVFYIEPAEGPGWALASAQWVAAVATYVVYIPVLGLAIAGLLGAIRRETTEQLTAVLAKAALLGLLVQPFVHVAGARYWTTAAPLLALIALGVLRSRRDPGAGPTGAPSRLSRGLTGVQHAMAGGVVLVLLLLALFAI